MERQPIPQLPLVSPRKVFLSALVVNALVALLAILYNSILLSRIRHLAASLVAACLWIWLVVSVKSRLLWWLLHCVSAILIWGFARLQLEDYLRQRFRGQPELPLSPLLALLCALQILSYVPTQSAPVIPAQPPSQATRPQPTPGQDDPGAVQIMQVNKIMVSYSGIPKELAQTLTQGLIEVGFYSAQQESQLGIQARPEGLRFLLVLAPQETALSPQKQAGLLSFKTRLGEILQPPLPIVLEVYSLQGKLLHQL